MPFVLYLLGLAVFAQATSEFMLSGLGPDIAQDLDVSIPAAGWLTSAFALGMIAGCSFTYLSPILTEVTGLGVAWVPVLLALFGLGSFAGVTVAGRYADRHDHRLVLVAGGILLLGWCGFALMAAYVVPSVVLVLLQGALSFAAGSTLIAYTLYAGSQHPVPTGGLATAPGWLH